MPEPPTDLLVQKCVYTAEYIYFFGGYTFASNMVGAFNRTTLHFDWLEDLTKIHELNKFNNLKDIQFGANKLYVLDTDGNLYIFEKEIAGKEYPVFEEKPKELPDISAYATKVFKESLPQEEFYKHYPIDQYYIEVGYDIKESLCCLFASLEQVFNTTLELQQLDVFRKESYAQLRFKLLNKQFEIQLHNDDFEQNIFRPINEHLQDLGIEKKLVDLQILDNGGEFIIFCLIDKKDYLALALAKKGYFWDSSAGWNEENIIDYWNKL